MFAYMSVVFEAIASVWDGLLTGQNNNQQNDASGLAHQLLETPNTIGCLHGESTTYASTSTQELTFSDSRYYCAKAYVVDQLELSVLGIADMLRSIDLDTEADVLKHATRIGTGKVRFAYRAVTVLLFGPYQSPPASPGYPAPPSPPPQPPPPPNCLVPAIKAIDHEADTVKYGVGLEAWNIYGCGWAENNPTANILTHNRIRGSDSNFTFQYKNKQWSFTEVPTNLTVECFFVSGYGAYGEESWGHSLCPVPAHRQNDSDAHMCTLSGYPSPEDIRNVDTNDLRTIPNVFTFNYETQETCSCDDQHSAPVTEDVLYTCPTSKWYSPAVVRGEDQKHAIVLSHLTDAD
ncbi:hypothetical protein CYMTET_48155 [Cymbomonas tetramitiformis]|uniref:Uncharacterized protein n=1 Tax=Cymbomonas tetramitiformis TaxID=36881 RepID=A0AAE0EW09_9CHLO|nr:hypothetical protein CYMTET_48155 [Cymbomonas tetramitiformis]